MNEDKGTRYRRAERALRAIEVAAAAATLAAVTLTPLARVVRDVAVVACRRVGLPSGLPADAVVATAVIGAVLLPSLLASLPFTIRREFGLAGRFGLPTRRPAAILRSRARWLLVCAMLGGVTFAVFAAFAIASPVLAGALTTLMALTVAGLVMLGAPWVITLSPRVRPLSDEATATRLQALASRAALRLAGLHEWVFGPGSDDANAALIGVVGPRRLLVSDTLLHGSAPDDVDAVVAHELGHHVHGHTWRRVQLQAASFAVALLLAHLAAVGPAAWVGGTGGATDPASLPWMIGAGALAWLGTRPWRLRQSRVHEAEADAFALRLTGRPEALERVLTRLGARNLASEDASFLTRAFFLTHPPIHARIAAARRAAAGPGDTPPER